MDGRFTSMNRCFCVNVLRGLMPRKIVLDFDVGGVNGQLFVGSGSRLTWVCVH